MKNNFLLILFSCAFLQASTQEIPAETELELETLANATESDVEDDAFFQEADHYRRHPLNLNNADAAELRSLRLLSDLQVENLLTYRRLFGPLLHRYEMQAIPGWDLATIRRVLPFVRVASVATLRENLAERLKAGEHMVILRASRVVELSKGFMADTSGSAYKGSPLRLLFRYRYKYKNLLQFGILGDKDAGEQFLKGAQALGFDFYSFHCFLRKIGIFESIALGDFTVNLGQGLIHWQGLAFGRSGDMSGTKRQSPVLRPYNSPGEFQFHRGVGFTMRVKNAEATVFASSRRLNANLSGETTEGETPLSSFLTSGNNRTDAEIADRHSVHLLTAGGNLRFIKQRSSFHSNAWQMGVNGVIYHLSAPLLKRDLPYNLFSIRGNQWMNASVDYSLTWKNMHFFGEMAVDRNMNLATVNGLLISLDQRAELSFMLRMIPPAYQSLYGNAFTAGTSPTNEKGFFTGLSIRPTDAWRINLYADVFSFPWLRFRVDAPSSGSDFLVQITCTPSKQLEWYMRFALGNKNSNSGEWPGPANRVVPSAKRNWRTHFSCRINPDLTVRGRVEAAWYEKKEERRQSGLLSYFDLLYKPMTRPWSMVGRIQYFDTDGYDARLYAYENDVLYGSSIPVFSGKGVRYYFILHYDIRKNISTWLKFSQTICHGVEEIGSALDAIPGNKRTEIKLQLRFLF